MKKLIFLFCLLLVLAGCSNTPESIDIQATVDSAVSAALAPYTEKMDGFVSQADLEAAQTEQNQKIQQFILDQIEQVKTEVADVPVQPEENSIGTVEYTGYRYTPTPEANLINDPLCVDEFTFVSDLTVPDGMTITPGTNFQKSWYITNSGTCTWNSNYRVLYHSGDNVGRSKEFALLQPGYYIKPGESTVVSVDLIAPHEVGGTYTTYWSLKSPGGDEFGAGQAKNIYLSSNFRVESQFVVTQNFGSLQCSDDYGYFTCGINQSDGSRGSVYYDDTPMLESGRSQGNPAIAVRPPSGENTVVRFEFGPLRFPRRSNFYTNFCCRPDTPSCDVQVRLYIREPGYSEMLVQEIREWNEGLMGEWKFVLDDIGIFDQDFTYILEVQSNGGADPDDLILFTNTRIF